MRQVHAVPRRHRLAATRSCSKIERGEGADARSRSARRASSDNIAGKTLCAFGDAAATPVLTTLKHFRHEYEAHIREGRCTLPADWRARADAGRSALTMMLRCHHADRSSRSSALIFVVFNALRAVGGRHGVGGAQGLRATSSSASARTASASKGLLQPFADVIKLMFKEELRPKAADTLALRARADHLGDRARSRRSAVVPFGAETTLFGLLDEPMQLQVADVNVAVLVIFAITSMGVYGIVLAGWSSNSKYSLLGGLRSSAQMISYELSYGLALAAVLLLGQLAVAARDRQRARRATGSAFIPRWFMFLQPLGFLIYMTAGIAETNRAPFDFPEAEQELVAGYHTEYSCMSFAMFFLAEYINMVTVSAVATDLFLGGWHGPFLPESLGWIWFLLKVVR